MATTKVMSPRAEVQTGLDRLQDGAENIVVAGIHPGLPRKRQLLFAQASVSVPTQWQFHFQWQSHQEVHFAVINKL